MSSNTQFHYEPPAPPTYTINSEGNEAFSFYDLLGQNGCKLLQKTLKDLPEIKKKMGLEKASILNWEKVQAKKTDTALNYRLILKPGELPKDINSGTLSINLRINNYSCEVGYNYKVIVSHREKFDESVLNNVRKMVNRSVNQLFAVSVSVSVDERIKEYVQERLKERVQLKATNFMNVYNVQNYAEVNRGY